MNMRKICLPLLAVSLFLSAAVAQDERGQWPSLTSENKPGARWWWLGSAVDTANLTWNMEALSAAGISSVEITPIYGVKGKDSLEIPYLSDKWMAMLRHVYREAGRLDMVVDMNGGTGWPFGGQDITPEYAASRQLIQTYEVTAVRKKGRKLVFEEQVIDISVNDPKQKPLAQLGGILFVGSDGLRRHLSSQLIQEDGLHFAPEQDGKLYVLYVGKTRQAVKRAAPGGEGLVMNHLSQDALNHYLQRFDESFARTQTPWPHSFFNDSYEVYGADWSENLLEEFRQRCGYDLADYLPEFLGEGDAGTVARVVCDYRATVAGMLLDNFTRPWTEWAHGHGVTTRNQAHGSPGNLLDLYSAMDIPECESFGCTQFDIPRLRVDADIRRNDANPATLRYASSAAHVSGKPLTSCESMTWLTEHFRTSLALIKPEMDQLFTNGINRVYYHGSPYTPREASWPGWLFYASILVNPNNTIFKDMAALNTYIARVQSFMQAGLPDNELLLYFPIYDIWENYRKGNYVTFDIHKLGEKLPRFDGVIDEILTSGYEMDYVSDAQLAKTKVEGSLLKTDGGTAYRAVLVPACEVMPLETLEQLLSLASSGAQVIFLGGMPSDVPGLYRFSERRETLAALRDSARLPESLSDEPVCIPYGKGRLWAGTSLQPLLQAASLTCEPLVAEAHARLCRREMPDGHTYFVSMLENDTLCGYVALGKPGDCAMIFDPMTGRKGSASVRDGKLYLQLLPGESLIVRTYDSPLPAGTEEFAFYQDIPGTAASLNGRWTFRFVDGMTELDRQAQSETPETVWENGPVSWTEVDHAQAANYTGSGVYTHTFRLPKTKADTWYLDFADGLYESARIRLNGQEVGTVWCVPYRMDVGPWLKPGKNTLEIEVTNLPANRIADYDRRGVEWRIFKDINLVSVFYKPITFDVWATVPGGLVKAPMLVPEQKVTGL